MTRRRTTMQMRAAESAGGLAALERPLAWPEALAPRRLLEALRAALARRLERITLAELDDRLLADIGVTREAAIEEARRGIWR